MSTHDKPKAQTFTAGDWRVTVTAIDQKPPTGLSIVGWHRSGYEVNVRGRNLKTGETFSDKCAGGLMWRSSGGCAWSLGSRDGMWGHGNTLNKDNGGPWSYRTDQFAFNHLVAFIKLNLESGVTHLTRELA